MSVQATVFVNARPIAIFDNGVAHNVVNMTDDEILATFVKAMMEPRDSVDVTGSIRHSDYGRVFRFHRVDFE